MHQDFDPRDLEPAAASSEPAGIRRWLPLAIALAAVSGFGGIVWYAYGRSSPQVTDNPALAPLIQADIRDYKHRPDNPGGAVVPNQDKLLLNQGVAPTEGRVERILPPPEAPLPKPVTPPPQMAATAPPPAPAPRVTVQSQTVPSGNQTVPVRQPQTVSAPMPLAPVASPTPGALAQPGVGAPPKAPSSPVDAPASTQAAATSRQVAAASAPKAVANGAYRIQLAAVKTAEQAEKEWQRIKGSNPEMANLHMTSTRVDLGEKGVFYRVQAGPVADATAADRLCAGLKSKGQGCIVVRP